jgi:hypothetical protein
MRPLSTRVFEMDATYAQIIQNIDSHKELKKMKALVMEEKVVFIIYRGGETNAVIMMNLGNGFHASVQSCPKNAKLKTNADLLYALCYGF